MFLKDFLENSRVRKLNCKNSLSENKQKIKEDNLSMQIFSPDVVFLMLHFVSAYSFLMALNSGENIYVYFLNYRRLMILYIQNIVIFLR